MVWTTQSKDLGIVKTTDHPNATAGVMGRALGVKGIHFTPLELFGAAARCSHLHFVNPALATPESLMIGALIEQYVDNVSTDFSILATAGNFKDFVKSYFVGTVASGLAYLAMIEDGYYWGDHFENVTGGNPTIKRSPDYVFTGNGTGTALLESKGTRSAALTTFDGTVETGYLDQVEPHLGHNINGVCATHGFAIGAWMTSTTKAEMHVHHTTAITSIGPRGAAGTPSLTVQQHSYATAMGLVQGPELASQIRRGRIEDVPAMFRFHWLERSWLMSPRWMMIPPFWDEDVHPHIRWLWSGKPGARRPEGSLPFMGFAIDEQTAKSVFSRFSQPDTLKVPPLNVEPLPEELRGRARRDYDGRAGAVFPDGLALIGWGNRLSDPQPVRWIAEEQRFV